MELFETTGMVFDVALHNEYLLAAQADLGFFIYDINSGEQISNIPNEDVTYATTFDWLTWLPFPPDSSLTFELPELPDTLIVDESRLLFSGQIIYDPFLPGETNFSKDSKTNVENFHLSTTTSTKKGGGLAVVNYAQATLIGNLFDSNVAAQNGGGIYINNGGRAISFGSESLIISGDLKNFILGNKTDENGAGIYCANSNPELNFILLSDNVAGINGGGLYFENSNPIINHITFKQNVAGNTGGAIYSNNLSAPKILNSILWNNSPNEIYVAADSIDVTFSDIKGGWQGYGNIDKDPLFEDSANNNFHLSWPGYPFPDTTQSPCIDTGNPVFSPDPDGTIADMGTVFFNQTMYTSFISDIPDTCFAEDHSLSFDLDNFLQPPQTSDSSLTWHASLIMAEQTSFSKRIQINSPENNISVKIDSVTHIVTFTARENYFAEDIPIIFTATDNNSIADSDLMLLTITPVNDPPVIENFPATVEFSEDSSFVLALNDYVSDPDNPDSSLTWSVSGQNSVTVAIERITNRAKISVSQSWFGWETLIFQAMDDSSAFDQDTLRVHVLQYTKVEDDGNHLIPDVYSLNQNYPNPFNPETTIQYGLPVSNFVSIKLYDTLGKEVITLIDKFMEAGYHSVILNANVLNSGLYFYKISTGDYTSVKKCIILK